MSLFRFIAIWDPDFWNQFLRRYWQMVLKKLG